MSEVMRTVLRYVNTDRAYFVSSDNGSSTDGNNLTIWVGTHIIVQCHLRLDDGVNYFKPETGSSWYFGVDDVYGTSHADYIATLNADFNIAGDWSLLNVAGGLICFRVDATTTALKTVMSGIATKNMIGELWYTPPGGKDTLLCQMTAVIKNIVTDGGA